MLIKVGDKVRDLDTGQEGIVEGIFDGQPNGVGTGQPRTLRIRFPMVVFEDWVTPWGGLKYRRDTEVEKVSGEESVRCATEIG